MKKYRDSRSQGFTQGSGIRVQGFSPREGPQRVQGTLTINTLLWNLEALLWNPHYGTLLLSELGLGGPLRI